MENPLSISAFWQAMQSDDDSDSLMAALRRLCDISDPQAVTFEIKKGGPSPLGSWGGWSY